MFSTIYISQAAKSGGDKGEYEKKKKAVQKWAHFPSNPLFCPIEGGIWTSFLMVSFSRLLEQMEKLEIQKTDKHENKVTTDQTW